MIKNINPFSRTVFDRNLVKYQGKFYTYLFFNNFSSQEISRLYKLISSIERNIEVKVILNKKSYEGTLATIKAQIQNIMNTTSAETAVEKESAMKVLKDVTIAVQNTFAPNRMIELERKQSELEGKQERVVQSQSGETDLSIIIRLEVSDQLDAIKACDQIELKARGFGMNIEQGTSIQKMLHRAFTGQIKKYEWEHLFTFNPNAGSVVPAHLQHSLEAEEVSALTLDYFSTTKLTDSSIYLGSTKSGKAPFFWNLNLGKTELNHTLVVGTSRSGKSAFTKDKIALQAYNLGYRVIVLDPKQDEYKMISEEVGGFELDSKNLSGINLLNLKQFKSLIGITPLFQTLLETVTGAGLTSSQKVTLNQILNQTKVEGDPKPESFLKKIKESELAQFEPALRSERLFKMLTSEKEDASINEIDNRFIRFSFTDVEGSELNLLVAIVAKVINTLNYDSDVPTFLIIDEAFKFLSQGSTSKEIQTWFRTFASLGVNIVLLEQDVRGYGELAETLFSLCEHCFFFKHEPIKQFDIPADLYTQVSSFRREDRHCLYIGRNINQTVIFKSVIADNHLKYVQPK